MLTITRNVFSNDTVTSSGYIVYGGLHTAAVSLVVNIVNSPTGTSPTIQFTASAVDPNNHTTIIGSTASTTAITGTTTQSITLPDPKTGTIKVSWSVSGTNPSFSGVSVTLSDDESVTARGAASETTLAAIKAKTDNLDISLSALQTPTIKISREFNDAFGRFRVSMPMTLFDSKQIADKQPLHWDDQLISGSGGASTYNTNQASTTLSVSANTACVRARQTYRRFNYQSGKSHLILQSGIIGTPVSGITRRIGAFEDSNGAFFESSGSTVKVVTRSKTSGSVVDTQILQSNWNLDKMDGTGPSGITVDWSKAQIFGAFFEWLGAGSIWFFMIINGETYLIHRKDHANIETVVWTSNSNLPMRYEIRNDGTGQASSLTHICSTIISEGGTFHRTGTIRGENRADNPITTSNNTNIYPIFAMRLGANYTMADIELLQLSLQCTSSATFAWYLILNPTINGTALSFSTPTNSAIELAKTATSSTSVSGGTIYASGVELQSTASASIQLPSSEFRLGAAIDGTRDVLVIGVQRLTGGSETFYGAINWREVL